MVRLGLAIGVLSMVLAATVSIASGQERVPVPGGVYAGTLTGVTGVCSDGPTPALTITISDYGNRIERFTLTTVYPLPTPSSSFSLPTLPIPVAADGSFSQNGSLQLNGRFASTGVSGLFRFDEGDLLGCAGAFTAQLQPSERVQQSFDGQIPLLDGCGGGAYSITRSADLLSIVRISVEGFHAGEQLFSGSGTFPEGTVPIDPGTGSFDWVYFPGREPGQEIALSGSFASLGLGDLAFSVSPSTCSVIGVGQPRPGGVPLGGKGGGGLPGSGGGPSGHGEGPASWWLLLGGGGIVAAGAAFAVRRRAARSRR